MVIGGTGHIGGFLVPQLVELGHEVLVATRGRRPRPAGKAWEKVKLLKVPETDRPAFLAEQGCDALIDIVQAQATAVYEALRDRCRHFIWCGSLWMLGPPAVVPTPEVRFGPALVEAYQRRMDELVELQRCARRDGVAFTAILPPNICGPGKVPLEMSGGRDIEVHRAHARGEPVTLFRGCNTLIGPCDAEDVAQGFWRAVESPDAAAGELFNVGSAYALTATQMVELFSEIHGVAIPIRRVSFEQFTREVMPDVGANNHFRFHMCPDISKARRELGYQPKYTPESTMARAVEWMRQQRLL
ncbi:MAG: hypothetical protein AMJ81_01055 [Phycisphaerae bacterium SM23_33]|nr:MAG: hypothetical protein AMJ81_01055 [Phycisphaerae bacterium SM23_33]